MNDRPKRRLVFAVVGMVAWTVVSLPLIPSASGQVPEPRIEFLNPSGFNRSDAGIVVSDTRPDKPSLGSSTFHLVAWTKNAPDDAGVEFELLRNGISVDTFDNVAKVGSDSYETEWDIPDTLPDGVYSLRATLFSGNEGIDTAQQEVTITRLGERAELAYPTMEGGTFPGGATFGSFAPLATAMPGEGDPPAARKLPLANLDPIYTTRGTPGGAGTTWVRAFYTVTEPGNPPQWIACGTEETPGRTGVLSSAANGVRCTLTDPAHQTAVTAVAVTANTSRGNYDPAFNAAGDALRVLTPYAQVPTGLSITAGNGTTVELDPDLQDYPCHEVAVLVLDQLGREVIGANVDAHAWGPTDRLRFGTGLLDSGIAPDRGHALYEPGYDCFSESGDTSPLDQGEHQILGGPDVKHLESEAAGTSDTGAWTFTFKVSPGMVSPDRFTTQFVVWLDELDDGCAVNDDLDIEGELQAAGSVGFGQAPLGPTGEERDTAVPCHSPLPEPEPTITPPPPPDPGARSISIVSSRQVIRFKRTLRFAGQITGEADCAINQLVKLKARPAGSARPFGTIRRTTTSEDARYRFAIRARSSREYRAVAPATESCQRARSSIVLVRVRN